MISGITSDEDLKLLAKKINIKLNGIFFKNELPQIPHQGNYIINLSSSNDGSGGTHWCYLFLTKDNDYKALYFDPFGMPEPSLVTKFIMKWVNNKHNNIIRNNIDIQNLSSNYCGQYCLLAAKAINFNPGTLEQRLHNFIYEYRKY